MLTEEDKTLLNAVQGDLPIASHPFAALAEQLATDEETLLTRLRALMAAGYVRRMGAYFQSEALGYQGSLVALEVEPARLEEVAAAVELFGELIRTQVLADAVTLGENNGTEVEFDDFRLHIAIQKN